MEPNRFVPGLAAVVRLSAAWCSLFWLFSTTRSPESLSGIAALPLTLGAVLAYLTFALFLRVPRTLPALTILGAVLSAALCAVLLGFYASLRGFWPVLIGILAIISLVIRAETLCVSPISAARSILGMEGSVAFFLFFLFYLTIKDLEMRLCLPLLAASLLSLYAILCQRLAGVRGDARRHSRLLVFLPLLLLVFTVAAALAFLRFGADALASGTLRMYHALLAALLFLGRALLRFLQWLAALFPAAEAGGVLPEPLETAMGERDLTLPDSDPRLLMVAVVLVLLVVLGIGIYVVYRLRRVRFGQRRVVGASAVTRQRPTLGRWLRRVLAHITFSLTLLARYQTPQALYYRLLRTGQALGRPQRPGETPCAYVRRMADCAGENTALPAAMEALELACRRRFTPPGRSTRSRRRRSASCAGAGAASCGAARLRRGLGLFTRPRAKAVRQPQPPQ